MKLAIIASTIVLGVALCAQSNANAATADNSAAKISPAVQHHKSKSAASRSSSDVVTYDRDFKDPNVGWHTQGGWRVCTEDCDNPEIPGSGYTCKNVQVLGMAMRECNSSNW